MRETKVRHVMTSKVYTAQAGDSLAKLRRIMDENDVRHVPILDKDYLVGIVSHRDLLRNALIEQDEVPRFVEDKVLTKMRASDVMTSGVESVDPETDLEEAAQILLDTKYGCLPVVDGTTLVGIITDYDFIRLAAGS